MMNPLGIYLHIPFCVKKCDYCDFLSFPLIDLYQKEKRMEEYLDALKNEIRTRSRGLKNYRVNTIFLGGGTPTVLSGSQLDQLFSVLHESFSVDENAEITMEANPGTLTKDQLSVFVARGGNRLSLGLQSAQERELELLGRIHRFKEFEQSFFQARAAGIENINIDLMSALPGQSAEDFFKTLSTVLTFEPEHLSVYSLIIEEGTPFYERYRKDEENRERGEIPHLLPTEETERLIYHQTGEILNRAGYEHYEISNYARKNRRCRHNENCWKRIDYAGFGLGASSFFDPLRRRNETDLEQYIKAGGLPPFEEEISLSIREQMEEMLFLGLRLSEGVSISEFEDKFHQSPLAVFSKTLKKYQSTGHLLLQDGHIFFTDRGRDVANMILADFLL